MKQEEVRDEPTTSARLAVHAGATGACVIADGDDDNLAAPSVTKLLTGYKPPLAATPPNAPHLPRAHPARHQVKERVTLRNLTLGCASYKRGCCTSV